MKTLAGGQVTEMTKKKQKDKPTESAETPQSPEDALRIERDDLLARLQRV